jgi:N-terminal TM domain of oligopeptide transport permease C
MSQALATAPRPNAPIPDEAPAGPEIESQTPWQLFWVRFRADRVALVALGFIVLEVLVALVAPVIVHAFAHPPNAQYPGALNQVFGTPTGPSTSRSTRIRAPSSRPSRSRGRVGRRSSAL